MLEQLLISRAIFKGGLHDSQRLDGGQYGLTSPGDQEEQDRGKVRLRLYRSSILLLSALLLIAAALLTLGDWHFLSDVMAGAFVGISAGFLAGKVRLVHSR